MSDFLPFNCISFGDTSQFIGQIIPAKQLKITPCNPRHIKRFVEFHHYSKNMNGVKITFCFKVEFDGFLVGAVVFGAMSTTAWKRFSKIESEVIELRRLVLIDEAGRNSESRVIGYCLRWIKKNAPTIKVIVSYADPAHGHSGTVYKATNFKYLGVGSSDKGFKDQETGKIYHSRAMRTKYKGEYKPFVKRIREKLENGLLEVIDLPGKHCYIYTL